MSTTSKVWRWAVFAAWGVAIVAMLAMMQGCGGTRRYQALADTEAATIAAKTELMKAKLALVEKISRTPLAEIPQAGGEAIKIYQQIDSAFLSQSDAAALNHHMPDPDAGARMAWEAATGLIRGGINAALGAYGIHEFSDLMQTAVRNAGHNTANTASGNTAGGDQVTQNQISGDAASTIDRSVTDDHSVVEAPPEEPEEPGAPEEPEEPEEPEPTE